MVNREQDSTLTIRLPEAMKQQLIEKAKTAGIPLSEYIRDILLRGWLPEDFMTNLSPKKIERLEKWARRHDKSVADVVARLLPSILGYYLDKVG